MTGNNLELGWPGDYTGVTGLTDSRCRVQVIAGLWRVQQRPMRALA